MELIRRNPGINLLVPPSLWGKTHAELLGITLKKRAPVEHPTPVSEPGSKPSKGLLRPSTTISELAHSLSELLQPTSAHPDPSLHVGIVLGLLYPNVFGNAEQKPKLDLIFGNRRGRVAVPLMWNYPDSADKTGSLSTPRSTVPAKPAMPMVCYVDTAKASSRQPLPMYLAGVFIAMAQKHFATTPQPAYVDLTLRIVTHDSKAKAFIVYTGHVTTKLLQRFAYPYEAPMDYANQVDGLEIEKTPVPMWPILGCKERLGQAMGEEVVGPVNPALMETHMPNEPTIPSPSPTNRRRSNADDGGMSKPWAKRPRIQCLFPGG